MKQILGWLLIFCVLEGNAQNVGIGTATPAARLHVSDSAVLFTGPTLVPLSTLFAPPASGIGTRFMWYPQKAALRSGYVEGANWDKDSIGIGSVGFGFNVKAIGDFSTSLGYGTSASAYYSTSFGANTLASGYTSTSMGSYTLASGDNSTSMGGGTIASGFSSTSLGYSTTASGYYSTSMGAFTTAKADYSTSLGFVTIAKSSYSLVIGKYNDTTASDRIFEVGNGMANNVRRNALTVLANGNTGIGTASPALISGGTGLHVSNNTYTQLRLQSSAGSAGLELTPAAGRNYEVQADALGNFFVYDRTISQYRLFLNNNGYFGIGLTNPTRPLSFPATLEKKISFYPGATGDVGISVSGNDLRLYADNANARVSFGYDDFTTGFTSRAYVLASGTTALVVQGNMTVNGTNYNSDARFKQHIQPLQGALEKVTALQGVQYEMRVREFPDRNFQQGTEIGLIAQEVEKVLPELVRTDADGYKSVDYAKLVPVLIEGMKTQQDQIRVLQSKTAALEKQNALLLELLNAKSDKIPAIPSSGIH